MNRVIYTYWDKAPLPPLVKHCIATWKTYNPDWRVVVVDKKQAMQNLAPPPWFEDLIPQHQADWVRLKLLAQTGGVWLDATTYLLKPVTAWATRQDALTIFAIDGMHQTGVDVAHQLSARSHCRGSVQLENWALACPKGHDFVQAWLKQFELVCELGHVSYVTLLKKQNLYPKCFAHSLPYFNQHLAAAVVHQNKLYRDPINVLSMCCAIFCSVSSLVSCLTRPPSNNRFFFKMTGGLRKYLHFASVRGLYHPRSLAAAAHNMPQNPWPARRRLLVELVIILLIVATVRATVSASFSGTRALQPL